MYRPPLLYQRLKPDAYSESSHIVRCIGDTEVQLLSRHIMRMQPGALPGPLASAERFRAGVQPGANEAGAL